ncbi:hypothetical protein ACSHWB_01375 [Lentzea sp. HUAS TT2]|uniref:hypothetical protein n=1 Tax=Lentzea sp. HUAS TT2 TaxID=3447454 RepID=UPI003F730A59
MTLPHKRILIALLSVLMVAGTTASAAESSADGSIEGMNLRLCEPQAERWSLTFVSMRDGLLTPAVFGGFRDGVGEFHGDDQLGGRPIKVRFLVTRQGKDRATFEQAFSGDGGTTWETNWVAVDRRIS